MAQLFAQAGFTRIMMNLGRKKCDMANGIYLMLAAVALFCDDVMLSLFIRVTTLLKTHSANP